TVANSFTRRHTFVGTKDPFQAGVFHHGFSSSAGGSVMGSQTGWKRFELALQELILENERESKAEKTGDEDVEVDPNETILTKEEEKEVQRIIRGPHLSKELSLELVLPEDRVTCSI
ncbi:hypothetical protein QZH41_006572, partial [Actinostola sp. cb2023]